MSTPLHTEKTVFLEAAEIASPTQRAAFLELSCGDDRQLRAAVEALLLSHQRSQGVLDATTAPLAEHTGTIIGPYKLLQQIGEGGMGVVFMAEQTEPIQRTVALKIIKPGMDTRQVIARFEAERQALALMDHPNIARVLDVGATDTGRPYFVMDLVKGVPITDYCDRQHLSVRQRLELLFAVCHAVQHAHLKGIIHRDLKPSNVLVAEYDGHPVPKIIDFGVAKATASKMTEKTMFTELGQVLGTLEYMSPEQARFNQLDIDTRSDIYSLGVLLYELLTGSTPFGRKRLNEAAFDEMLRIIREEEPPKPSTRLSTTDLLPSIAANRGLEPLKLNRLVQGELDWIVMKALEKDRNRRYETASGLADDIGHYLADEQVQACPPSAWYRFRKFARRHKRSFVAAALLALLLVLGSTISIWFAVRATRAEGLAVDRFESERQARQLAANQQRLAEEERARAERLVAQQRLNLYASRMKLAHEAWQSGDVARVLELLNLEQPRSDDDDQRGFEWHYLWRLCHSQKLRLAGESGRIRAIAALPDGLRLFSAADDGAIRLWSLRSGKQLSLFTGHTGIVSALAVSPDGKWLASAGVDKTVRLWDVNSGKQTITFPEHKDQVTSVAFSPDGQLLATGTGHIATGAGAPPDRFYKLTAGGDVTLFESATAREVAKFADDRLGGITSLEFSPDGATLAIGAARQGAIWNVQQQAIQHLFHSGSWAILSVAFSPSGKTLATAGYDGSVRLWDAATGEEISTPMRHRGPVMAVAFSPDGQTLASAGTDQIVRLWDPNQHRELDSIKGHTGWISALAFAAGGRDIISGSWDGDVKVWDGRQPQDREVIHHARSFSVAFSPDGGRLVAAIREVASGANGANVWDTTTGKIESRVRDIGPTHFVVAVNSDHRTMALAGLRTGQLHVSDLNTGKTRLDVRAHQSWLWTLAFSPDGKLLATGGSSTDADEGPGEIKLWDVDTCVLRSSLPTGTSGRCRYLTFTPDGDALAGICHRADGSVLKFWDLKTLLEFRSIELSNADDWPVDWIAFSPSGTSFAISGWSRIASLWDTATFSKRCELKGHRDVIYHGTISPDGRTLATAGWDGVVKLWHVPTGQEMATLEATEGLVWSVAFSPDGLSLAAATQHGDAGQVVLWHASSGKPPLEEDNTND